MPDAIALYVQRQKPTDGLPFAPVKEADPALGFIEQDGEAREHALAAEHRAPQSLSFSFEATEILRKKLGNIGAGFSIL